MMFRAVVEKKKYRTSSRLVINYKIANAKTNFAQILHEHLIIRD